MILRPGIPIMSLCAVIGESVVVKEESVTDSMPSCWLPAAASVTASVTGPSVTVFSSVRDPDAMSTGEELQEVGQGPGACWAQRHASSCRPMSATFSMRPETPATTPVPIATGTPTTTPETPFAMREDFPAANWTGAENIDPRIRPFAARAPGSRPAASEIFVLVKTTGEPKRRPTSFRWPYPSSRRPTSSRVTWRWHARSRWDRDHRAAVPQADKGRPSLQLQDRDEE